MLWVTVAGLYTFDPSSHCKDTHPHTAAQTQAESEPKHSPPGSEANQRISSFESQPSISRAICSLLALVDISMTTWC